MYRISLAVVLFTSALLGCATVEQTEPASAMEAKVLAIAEPVIQKHMPDAYHQYKPFRAEHRPNTQNWEVYPASGIRRGAPVMVVRVGEESENIEVLTLPRLHE